METRCNNIYATSWGGPAREQTIEASSLTECPHEGRRNYSHLKHTKTAVLLAFIYQESNSGLLTLQPQPAPAPGTPGRALSRKRSRAASVPAAGVSLTDGVLLAPPGSTVQSA